MMRPYQVEAKSAVYREWERVRSTLLVMATGCGKTYVGAEILRERAKDGRILWLAHRSELLDQARDTLRDRIGLSVDLEKAQTRANRGHALWGLSDVVVGSVPTLHAARLREWDPRDFATIVVDEAHHATARTHRQILDYFSEAKVLGLTATPDRGDGVGLAPVFDTTAYQYDIRQAIHEGYLAPIRQMSIEVPEIDLSDVKPTRAGVDLSEEQLAEVMERDGVLHGIAAPLAKEIGDRPTIVFCVSVDQAKSLTAILEGYGIRAHEVDGNTPPEIRRQRLSDYSDGAVQALVNVGVLTEGYDAPKTSCIAMARPTKSRALYTQCIGRGTRIAPGKADCLVLDFVGNSGKHTLISPFDALAGKDIPPDIAKRAQQFSDSGMPALDALEKAEAEAEAEEKRRVERMAREAKLLAKVAHQKREVCPFSTSGHPESDRMARCVEMLRVRPSRGDAIDTWQADKLMRQYGWPLSAIERMTKAEARKAYATAAKGPTIGQAKWLRWKGLRTDISKQEAIDARNAFERGEDVSRWRMGATGS
jgi:superfamily II DNA or RNA helicase